jgi:hypothetical protein
MIFPWLILCEEVMYRGDVECVEEYDAVRVESNEEDNSEDQSGVEFNTAVFR